MSTHEYLSNDYFLLTLTFGVYFLAKLVRKLLRLPLFNPILVSIAFLIIFLRVADVDYEEYRVSGAKIDFWLKPAVVALGVPLYKQLSSIRQEILPILLSQLAGCVVGVVSVVGIARLMGASTDVVLSLAAKSVTTPIAMEVTESVGGIPALTATIVVFVGIFGAITGFRILRRSHRHAILAGYLAGYGFSCCGHFCSDGAKHGTWRLCFAWPHPQRHLHSHPGTVCAALDGGDVGQFTLVKVKSESCGSEK